MNRLARGVAATAVAIAATVLGVSPAFAHEQRQVGAYQFTVGWKTEPAYAGQPNAVQMFLKDAKGNPVDDLGSPPSIKVEVMSGNQTSPALDLAASFDPDSGLGTHGEFDAAIIPTRPGDFTVHLSGTVKGQALDEKFTSGSKTFATVTNPTDVQFPAKDPTVGDLSALTNRLSPRVDSAVAQGKSNADKASSAQGLAIAGIILGAVGLIAGAVIGGAGLRAARRARRA
jgi:hypothetical protein